MRLLLLPVWGLRAASFQEPGQWLSQPPGDWPSQQKTQPHPLDAVLGAHSPEMDPVRVDHLTTQTAPEPPEPTVQDGVYVLADRAIGKYLDAYVLPEGSVGAAHEAYVAWGAETLTQEWLIYRDGSSADGRPLYAVENRAAGAGGALRLEAGGQVVLGDKMRWHLEGDYRGHTISALDGRELAAGGGESYCHVVPKGGAPARWQLTMKDPAQAGADLTMGFAMQVPPTAVEMPPGVYDIHMQLGHLSACTQPDCGSGDYEASAAPMATQQWAIIPATGERAPGEPVYEIREEKTGLFLDAYQFGLFRSVLRGDDRRSCQRWFFEEAGPGSFSVAQLSDGRYLGFVEAGAAQGQAKALPQKFAWTLDYKGPLPAHLLPPPPPVCKAGCDAGLECGEQPDGCGEILQCGSCHSGVPCEHNVCVCDPYTCELTMCGQVDDGCGTQMDCGMCGEGLLCDQLTNGCVAAPMVPVLPDFATAELNGSNASNLTKADPYANATGAIVPMPPPEVEEPACNCTAEVTTAVDTAMEELRAEMAACGCGANATVAPNVTANVTVAPNVTANVTNVTNVTNATNRVEEIMRELAPALLARLRPVLVNATVATVLGLKDDGANRSQVAMAVGNETNASLTDDAIVAMAQTVVLSPEELGRIANATKLVAEKSWNQSFANETFDNEVVPVIEANFTLAGADAGNATGNASAGATANATATNATNASNASGAAGLTTAQRLELAQNRSLALRTMVELTDLETAPQVMALARANATQTAAHAALKVVNENQASFGEAAFEMVKNATINVASDIALNVLTYDVERDVLKGVQFKPEDVMFRTKRALHAAKAGQEVAADLQPLLLTRLEAVVSPGNATDAPADAADADAPAALAAHRAVRKLRLRA